MRDVLPAEAAELAGSSRSLVFFLFFVVL